MQKNEKKSKIPTHIISRSLPLKVSVFGKVTLFGVDITNDLLNLDPGLLADISQQSVDLEWQKEAKEVLSA